MDFPIFLYKNKDCKWSKYTIIYFTCSEVNNFDFEAHIVEMKW